MAKLNGHWYTDKNGNHYFVEDGQTPQEGWEASKRRKMIDNGKFKVSEDGKEYRDVNSEEYNKFEADENDFDNDLFEDDDETELNIIDDKVLNKENTGRWKELDEKLPEMREALINKVGLTSDSKNLSKSDKDIHNEYVKVLKEDFGLSDKEANAVIAKEIGFANDSLQGIAESEEKSDELYNELDKKIDENTGIKIDEHDVQEMTKDVHSKYSRTPIEEVEKIVREEMEKSENKDWKAIQEKVEDRLVNDSSVTGSNTFEEKKRNDLETPEDFSKKTAKMPNGKEMSLFDFAHNIVNYLDTETAATIIASKYDVSENDAKAYLQSVYNTEGSKENYEKKLSKSKPQAMKVQESVYSEPGPEEPKKNKKDPKQRSNSYQHGNYTIINTYQGWLIKDSDQNWVGPYGVGQGFSTSEDAERYIDEELEKGKR